MQKLPQALDRKLIPRWREFALSVGSQELSVASTKQSSGFAEEDLELVRKQLIWDRDRTLAAAEDLVWGAVSSGKHHIAITAAQFLVKENVSREITLEWAKRIILGTPLFDRAARAERENSSIDQQKNHIFGKIRTNRRRVVEQPRNVIAWMDLAYWYSRAGESDKSIRAMHVALRLNRNSRFILRSATRLLVHYSQPEEAKKILLQSELTAHDPWLMAAEISVSGLIGQPSKFFRQARRALAQQEFLSSEVTELAGAVATTELTSGNYKQARKFFNSSLVDPTDNSLAQAVWASERMTPLPISHDLVISKRAFEAEALSAMGKGDWEDVVQNCIGWSRDEPFATRPYQTGSYTAATLLEDYDQSRRFAEAGLVANPKDIVLLNNLIVSLAKLNRTTEAKRLLEEIDVNSLPDSDFSATILATRGLVAIRQGDLVDGQRFYDEAIIVARGRNLLGRSALAEIYLAEELLPFSIENAVTRLLNVHQRLKDSPDRDGSYVFHRVVSKVAERLQSGQVSLETTSRVAELVASALVSHQKPRANLRKKKATKSKEFKPDA